MKKRQGKIPVVTLVVVTLITIAFMTVELSIQIRTETPYYPDKIAAATRTASAFSVIKQAVDSLYIPIDPVNDPNYTGLIGPQFSPLTIEHGDLQPKLTATNPNSAAMFIQLLRKMHIDAGDTVAVFMTGSTPALNIAMIIALETINARPIMITSVSSAMWGANFPNLTMLDMERILYERTVIHSRSICAIYGGNDGTGRGLSPEGRNLIDSSASRNDVPLLAVYDVNETIDTLYHMYTSSHRIRTFIVITEHATALTGYDYPTGLIPAYTVKQGTGLIPRFSRNGVNIVHINRIDELAHRFGLPVAPIPVPAVGDGPVYHEYRHSVLLAVAFTLLLSILLFFVLRYDLASLFKRSK